MVFAQFRTRVDVWRARALRRLSEASAESPRARARMALCVALLPALVQLRPLWQKTPLSRDHPTHLFKAWEFWSEMLAHGRLHGWSHTWAFGSPSGELVPFGPELWIALFRALTFAQLSWTRTYALAFAGFFVFMGVATYAFARRFFGSAVAVLATWLALSDPGTMMEGGWSWYAYWGAWPVGLSMSCVLLAYLRLDDVLRRNAARDVMWAGLWIAAALLTHQLALFVFAVTLPLLVLDHLARTRGAWLAALSRTLAAVTFGVCLVAFFVVPFLARTSDALDLGLRGDPLGVVLGRVLRLAAFENGWAPIQFFAFVGATVLVLKRRRGSLFLVGSALAFIVLSSDVLVRNFHAERVLASIIKIESKRMLLVAKLFWFPLASYGFIATLRALLDADSARGRARRALLLAAGVALAALWAAPSFPAFYQKYLAKGIVGENDAQYWNELQPLFEWSRHERENSREHYRIAYHMWRHNHIATLAPLYDHTLFYKEGSTASQIFNRLPMTEEPELLRALSVKYVVSTEELNARDYVFERQFGAFSVYRFAQYQPDPFRVLGPGHADLLEFAPERIRIRLSGTSAESRLTINVASHARWRATLAGKPVPITTVPVYGPEYPLLMQVPAGDGELVLEYVYRTPDVIGLGLSLAALPSFLLVHWFARRRRGFEREFELFESTKGRLKWPALALLVCGVLFVALRTRGRAQLLPEASLFRHIDGSNLTLAGYACEERAPLWFQCGPHVVSADVVSGFYAMHLCMHAPDVGELRLSMHTRLGSFITGQYDPKEDPRGEIRLLLDGERVGAVKTRPGFLQQEFLAFDTRSRKGERATLELSLTRAALNCFDFQIEN